ncbi:hypothetical protein ABI59_12335 [Acidobacteria bacterium Mor1]|nr:hypothetical protein ABI59_12335 [Acidobacteria bacterium Mor1]
MRADADLHWRAWDDQYVVFHPPSGDTHLLNEAAARLLRRLHEGPATIADLVAAVEGIGDEAVPDMPKRVAGYLLWFDDLGLIEAADAPSTAS